MNDEGEPDGVVVGPDAVVRLYPNEGCCLDEVAHGFATETEIDVEVEFTLDFGGVGMGKWLPAISPKFILERGGYLRDGQTAN